MTTMRHNKLHHNGFTLVELMVVIAVLAVLVTITTVSMQGWRQHTAKTQVKSDLVAAASAMESYRNTNAGYPASLPPTFTASKGVAVTYASGNSSSYCLNGSVTGSTGVVFYVRSINGGTQTPQAGTCS